jgi:hypothetical protein
MTENKNVKRRGITLNTPSDARRIIRRIVDKAFATGQELEHAGKLSQLMTCWLKAWELEKTADLERRIAALETAQENKR